MASTQQVHYQTLLDEVMKEIDCTVRPNVKVDQEQQALTNGAIGNRTKHNLELKYISEYSGYFISSPAQIIEAGKATKFDHEGTPPNGSVVGMVYHANGHQWVMAWSVPLQNPATKPSLNRVYVEDGPDAEIDWNMIKEKLEKSGDSSTSPGAIAAITHGSIAKLAVLIIDPKAPYN